MEGKDKTLRRWQKLCFAVSVLSLGFAGALAFLLGTPVARADATSDTINSTVQLITSLLLALIPLLVIVAVFSFIIGILVGKQGLFSKMGRS